MELAGSLVRRPSLLRMEFQLTGELSAIAIPFRAAQPKRRDKLWEATCFELFFTTAETSAYHEINLSPAGHWNLYRFEAYRQGMREESIDCLRLGILPNSDSLMIRMEIDLTPLCIENKVLHVGPCAILLSQEEQTPSYWATAHPGPRPDFHDQSAWLSCNPARK